MSAQRPVSMAGEETGGQAACPGAHLLHRYRGASAVGRGARGGDQVLGTWQQKGGRAAVKQHSLGDLSSFSDFNALQRRHRKEKQFSGCVSLCCAPRICSSLFQTRRFLPSVSMYFYLPHFS